MLKTFFISGLCVILINQDFAMNVASFQIHRSQNLLEVNCILPFWVESDSGNCVILKLPMLGIRVNSEHGDDFHRVLRESVELFIRSCERQSSLEEELDSLGWQIDIDNQEIRAVNFDDSPILEELVSTGSTHTSNVNVPLVA